MQSSGEVLGEKRLYLGADVHFCLTEGQGIFLDLPRDDYSAVPIPDGVLGSGSMSESDIQLALVAHRADLIEAGLLTEVAAYGRHLLAYTSLKRPQKHIFDLDDRRAFGFAGRAGDAVRIQAADVADFAIAARRASKLLRTCHIFDVVKEVKTRKAAATKHTHDADVLKRHLAKFCRLRPWYPKSYLCLFDGLALIEFLARRKLFPDLVFGVQAQPFGAHCWVQSRGTLLNESLEYAGQFTPILVI